MHIHVADNTIYFQKVLHLKSIKPNKNPNNLNKNPKFQFPIPPNISLPPPLLTFEQSLIIIGARSSHTTQFPIDSGDDDLDLLLTDPELRIKKVYGFEFTFSDFGGVSKDVLGEVGAGTGFRSGLDGNLRKFKLKRLYAGYLKFIWGKSFYFRILRISSNSINKTLTTTPKT